MNRRDFLAALCAAPLVAAGHAVPAEGEGAASLDFAAGRRGRYFGAALRFDQLESDARLQRAVLNECGSITPEIHMKWDALNPAPGVWTTMDADRLAAFAARHGLGFRGHTLIWEQSTPAWVRAKIVANSDWSVVGDFIDTVVRRYDGRVSEWDVVNEPIEAAGLRPSLFQQAFGDAYVERALVQARQAAPRAHLMINDYGFDYDNPVEDGRRRSFLRLVEDLKNRGAPLDGVGLQAHLDLGKGGLKPSILRPFLTELAATGVSISITELDVKEVDLSLPVTERDRRVADEVHRYLDIVLDEPAVTGVTTWGLSDRHSWLTEAGAKLNRGLPYDADMVSKPMREAIRSGMAGRGMA